MFKKNNGKEYIYLLGYMFSKKVKSDYGEKEYTETGSGRTIMNLSKEICNYSDIYEVEKELEKTCGIDGLSNLSLMSFSLIRKDKRCTTKS